MQVTKYYCRTRDPTPVIVLWLIVNRKRACLEFMMKRRSGPPKVLITGISIRPAVSIRLDYITLLLIGSSSSSSWYDVMAVRVNRIRYRIYINNIKLFLHCMNQWLSHDEASSLVHTLTCGRTIQTTWLISAMISMIDGTQCHFLIYGVCPILLTETVILER